ncbi:MAG: sodium-dependent transporter [Planctomycetota bacterium]
MAETRERWASRPAFIMAAVGSAIGLGNVWRFPGTAFNNGGGAFFVPYFVALLTAGIPLMIVEYGLGSRFQGAAPKSYRALGRHYEWIGWWAVLIGMGISIYYCVILAWSWDYVWVCLKSIFTGELPWQANEAGRYFQEDVLELSKDAVTPGSFNVSVAVGLVITWAVVCWSIARGVHRVGKIVMITVPLPLVLLVILAIRGLTLDGALDGLAYYLTPDWPKLLDAKTWVAAYGQVFFSLSVGWGILIAYASYRPKDSDVVNNAYLTSFANCGFSFLAGFAVFSTLGYLAMALQQPIPDLKATSFGLAFTSYPTAIGHFPGAPWLQGLLGLGFFVMLLTLGIDSAFSIIEAVATAVHDKFLVRRERIVLWLCVGGCVLGLVYCFGAGLYWLDIADNFLANYSLPLVALVQTIVLGWIMGRKKFQAFQDDINRRSELPAGFLWKWSIKVVTPLVLAVSLVLLFLSLAESGGYGGYPFAALIWVGAVPVTVILLLSFGLAAVKGAGDDDHDA